MRWTFALLLLLNAGMWMWSAWYKNPAGAYANAPRPSINPEKMRLLSEPGVTSHPRVPAAPASEPLALIESVSSNQAACYTVGPFLTRDTALKASDKLRTLSFISAYRSEGNAAPSGYRVSLPPLKTRTAAEQKRKELDSLGIKDHSLIAAPEKKYAISLGIFAQPANAGKYQQELAKKGIKAEIEILYPGSRHWLDLPAGQMPPKQLDGLKRISWDSPDVRVSEIVCSSKGNAGPEAKKNKKL